MRYRCPTQSKAGWMWHCPYVCDKWSFITTANIKLDSEGDPTVVCPACGEWDTYFIGSDDLDTFLPGYPTESGP